MSSFTFKQFHINQQHCAMKVGTDGILLGAWADVSDCQYILDMGTGFAMAQSPLFNTPRCANLLPTNSTSI